MSPKVDSESSDDEYLFILGNSSRKVPVMINGKKIQTIVDSGATVNVLDSDTFNQLTKTCPVKLRESRVRVFPYGAEAPIPVKGSFTVTLIRSYQREYPGRIFGGPEHA